MKFTRKLFAVALALCLMLCLSVTAFAEEAPTTYKDQGKVEIEKTYNLAGSGTSPAETFKLEETGFSITDNDIVLDELSQAEKNAIDLAAESYEGSKKIVATVQFSEGDAGKTGAQEGKFEIDLPEYTKVGVYTYKLQEVIGTTAGVEYCEDEIRLVVTVVNSGKSDNSLARIAKVYVGSGANAKGSGIVNTYSAGTLNIAKTVAGNLGDKDKYFDFTVTLTGESGKDYAPSYTVNETSNPSNPTSIKVGETKQFKLKHNETLSIANLPKDVSYTVVETHVDGYETTVNKQKAEKIENAKINTTANDVNFVNTKNGPIDEGVMLDSLPYVLVLAAVLGGTVVMFTRKRRFED